MSLDYDAAGRRWPPPLCYWDHVENRFSGFLKCLISERLMWAGPRAPVSIISDEVAGILWDEDFLRATAYTRSNLSQSCAENA